MFTAIVEIKTKRAGLEMSAQSALDYLSEIKLVDQEIDQSVREWIK